MVIEADGDGKGDWICAFEDENGDAEATREAATARRGLEV